MTAPPLSVTQTNPFMAAITEIATSLVWPSEDADAPISPYSRDLSRSERELVARYGKNTPIRWLRWIQQSHAVAESTDSTAATLPTLCGRFIRRSDLNRNAWCRDGAEFVHVTCLRCWRRAVLIRRGHPPVQVPDDD